MAKYSASFSSVAVSAYADTSSYTSGAYPLAIQGGTSTQQLKISEVYIGGEASSTSSPAIMVLARDSTVAATIGTNTAIRNALTDATATAAATTAVVQNTWTTNPQRSATLHLLHLSFNGYGGIVRWVASPDQAFTVVGNTASLGEVSLSAYTGTTASTPMSGHVLYELV